PKITTASKRRKSHFMGRDERDSKNESCPRGCVTASQIFVGRLCQTPERPTGRPLRKRFPGRGLRERVAVLPPGEVAILTVKFFRENFYREENARDPRSDELPSQLRILNPR